MEIGELVEHYLTRPRGRRITLLDAGESLAQPREYSEITTPHVVILVPAAFLAEVRRSYRGQYGYRRHIHQWEEQLWEDLRSVMFGRGITPVWREMCEDYATFDDAVRALERWPLKLWTRNYWNGNIELNVKGHYLPTDEEE